MSKAELIEKIPISLSELKEEITKISKREGEELSFRTGKTLDYVNSFSHLSKKKSADILKSIEALNIPRLKPEHIVKILDAMPKSANELAVLLQGYTITVTKENMKKIVKEINE